MLLSDAPFSPLEGFLRDFHDLRPGGTSLAFKHLAVSFDQHSYPSSYAMLTECLPDLDQGRLLDLACGDGHLLGEIAGILPGSWELHGLDFSAGELQKARRETEGRIAYAQGKAQSLPYTSKCFDAVFSHMTLMLMEDLPGVLDEIHRVLKPGGVFATVTGGRSPVSQILQCFVDSVCELPRRPAYREVHFGKVMRNRDDIKQLLEARFGIVVAKTLTIPMSLSPEDAWDWFSAMYDLSIRIVNNEAQTRLKFLSKLKKPAYDHTVVLHYFHARN